MIPESTLQFGSKIKSFLNRKAFYTRSELRRRRLLFYALFSKVSSMAILLFLFSAFCTIIFPHPIISTIVTVMIHAFPFSFETKIIFCRHKCLSNNEYLQNSNYLVVTPFSTISYISHKLFTAPYSNCIVFKKITSPMHSTLIS